MNYNRVMIGGNLTRDIELKYTPSNIAVGDFGLAVNRKFKTKDGQQKEETIFVDCTAWGKQAEVMAEFIKKGRPVFIEGRLKLDQWEKDGQKRSKLRVIVEQFEFIDSKPDGGKKEPAQTQQHSGLTDDEIPF